MAGVEQTGAGYVGEDRGEIGMTDREAALRELMGDHGRNYYEARVLTNEEVRPVSRYWDSPIRKQEDKDVISWLAARAVAGD